MVSSMESWNRGMGERAEELEGVGVLVRRAELMVSRRKDKGDHHTQRSQGGTPPHPHLQVWGVGREWECPLERGSTVSSGRPKGECKEEELGWTREGWGGGSHTHIDTIPGEIGSGLLWGERKGRGYPKHVQECG